MTTVAVTGVSGYLGLKTLQALEAADSIARVVGIDTVPPSLQTQKLEFYELDVRAPELGDVVSGSAAIVHLASTSSDADVTREVNIGGTRSVAEAAVRGRVGKVVFASTHRVYGAHADNDFPLSEHSPLRPLPSDVFASSKIEAENVLAYMAESHPDMCVTTLRMAWVCGPGLPTASASVVDAPFRLAVAGYEPPIQVLGEDDAGRALSYAVINDIPGVFNVCSDDWLDGDAFGKRPLTISAQRAARTLRRMGHLGVAVPAGGAGALMYPQVMANDAYRAQGFEFTQTTAQAIEQTVRARAGWLAVGPLHLRPRRALLVGGTLGVVALGSTARRRRRNRSDSGRG